MNYFHNFTASIWELFIGNLLLLFCTLFYLAWWVVSYRPGSSGISASSGFYLTVAFITGIAAIVLMSYSINSLSPDSDSLSVKYIAISVGVLFFIMLAITSIIFHRRMTSELMLIHVWTALELSAVITLYGIRRFGVGRTAILSILIGIAYIVGLICYVLYYRLNDTASYWNGMIPLITDAFAVAVFLALMAV